MLKRASQFCIGVLALFCASYTLASSHAGWTVGVVNMQTIGQSPQVEAANQALQKEFLPEQEKMQKLYQTLKEDVDTFKKDGATLSKKNMNALQEKINIEQEQVQKEQADFQRKFASAQRKQSVKIFEKIKLAVTATAKKKNISIVLPTQVVLYVQNPIDMTNDVIKNLD